MKYFWLLILVVLSITVFSQKLDNTVSFRDMGSDQYFRINYDNDYFPATDYNYTQGYNLKIVTSHLSANPLNKVLIRKKRLRNQYGLSIEHMGHTPFSITNKNVNRNDRPFAATILLKSFITTTDTIHAFRVISALSLGMIGPFAFGNAMQTAIHKAIGDDLPQGWHNQIQNDFVVNYELGFEKKIAEIKNQLNSYPHYTNIVNLI